MRVSTAAAFVDGGSVGLAFVVAFNATDPDDAAADVDVALLVGIFAGGSWLELDESSSDACAGCT